jgi:hypothetical protein
MQFETNHDLLRDLVKQGKVQLAGDNLDVVHGPALRGFDLGLEAIVEGVEEYTGNTHEWVLAEPATISDINHRRVNAVTVYAHEQVYAGPEEGGWWRTMHEPVQVFLIDGFFGDPAPAVAAAQAFIDAEDPVDEFTGYRHGERHGRGYWATQESVLLTSTSVGGVYYC